ncbi:FUSC family protein [Streptomyces flaveolus]|uniref:FUSC family protein n=1 Tax=Streptomyces flaveolus TaxID=67297 RepID=A0ABV1VR75_9ACTN
MAALLPLERGHWAAISAAAVLHPVNLRITSQRAAQRALGTAAGLLLAFAALAAGVEPVVLAVLIVVPEFLPEYAVVRNHAPAFVFVTPPALLMSDLAAPAPAGELVLDRVLGSVVGIVVALGCALLVVHDRAAVRVARAGRVRAGRGPCRTGAQEPRRAAARPRPGRAGTAVVVLREADDAASGELWPAGIDPALLATTEQRACRLLARLHRPRP